MPLTAHLNELRKRLIICVAFITFSTVICYFNYSPIANFFITPFKSVSIFGGSINVNTIYEGFFVKLKLSFISGVLFSIPILLYQFCRFILPGLKSNEKKWLFIILIISSCLSMTSTYMGYTIVFPYIVSFLLTNEFIPSNINVLLNYQQNLSYIISFLIGSLLIFQSPIILSILLAKNMITRKFLWKNSRWFILGIVIVSAMITPPDIISQLTLSIPLILCYFSCILIAKFMKWGH